MPRFSLRALLRFTFLASVVLGVVGYVIQSAPRWKAERARAYAARARADAEAERQQNADLAEGQQLMADLETIQAKLGRYPHDEDELVNLRGKPMPLIHSRGGKSRPLIYESEQGDAHYRFVFKYPDDDTVVNYVH